MERLLQKFGIYKWLYSVWSTLPSCILRLLKSKKEADISAKIMGSRIEHTPEYLRELASMRKLRDFRYRLRTNCLGPGAAAAQRMTPRPFMTGWPDATRRVWRVYAKIRFRDARRCSMATRLRRSRRGWRQIPTPTRVNCPT